MKDEKEKRKRYFLSYLIIFVLLWILFILMVSAMAYAKHETGSSSFYDGIDAISHFRVFYWLNPVTWWSCLKWSVFYWALAGMFLIYQEKYHHDAAGIEAGSAHWNDRVEEFNKTHTEPFGEKTFSDQPGISEKNLNNVNSPPVPGNPNMIESQTVRLSTADMMTHLNNNVFIVGGAGTGKSRFFIKPNVLQMNCSYVVTDPSGELLKSMHNVLADNGYKIKVFNLVDMRYSNKYNPFKYIRTETDVSILVDCFISNTTAPDQRSSDPFWDKSEKALLTALIFYLVDIAGEEFQMFSTVLWMVQLAQMEENTGFRKPSGDDGGAAEKHFGFTLDTPLDELFNGNRKIVKKQVEDEDHHMHEVLEAAQVTDPEEVKNLQKKIETSLCLTNYKTFKLGGTKTLKSILISAAVRLNPFSIPAIMNLTCEDNMELEKVGDELTCLFAIIPQTNSTFNFLVSMLFSQMFESLYYKGASINNSRLNYHVRFLLDEFANIGKIPEFPQKISTCRKYNISTTIVLQSIAQIKMLYKDDYETIIGNCDTAICLGTNEQTTADYFSKKLGKSTITSRSKSMQVGKSGGSMSFQQTGRELMTSDEIMTMPFDECIVMMNHISPFYDKKYDLEKHPQFKNTGDGNKENFYSLKDDETFLCVNSADVKEMQTRQETEDLQDPGAPPLEPRPLKEVLGEILMNNPDEDGFFLIRDASPDGNRRVFTAYIKRAKEAVEKTMDCKTPVFDADNMDPALLSPVTSKLMSFFAGKIRDVFVYCTDISESDKRRCQIGVVDDNCNAVKTADKLKFTRIVTGRHKNPDYELYEIEGSQSVQNAGLMEQGCRNGVDSIQPPEEDELDDY